MRFCRTCDEKVAPPAPIRNERMKQVAQLMASHSGGGYFASRPKGVSAEEANDYSAGKDQYNDWVTAFGDPERKRAEPRLIPAGFSGTSATLGEMANAFEAICAHHVLKWTGTQTHNLTIQYFGAPTDRNLDDKAMDDFARTLEKEVTNAAQYYGKAFLHFNFNVIYMDAAVHDKFSMPASCQFIKDERRQHQIMTFLKAVSRDFPSFGSYLCQLDDKRPGLQDNINVVPIPDHSFGLNDKTGGTIGVVVDESQAFILVQDAGDPNKVRNMHGGSIA
jgi:hypothetical protein